MNCCVKNDENIILKVFLICFWSWLNFRFKDKKYLKLLSPFWEYLFRIMMFLRKKFQLKSIWKMQINCNLEIIDIQW